MERIWHPEIVPLELSDIWVNGATLWEQNGDLGFASALRHALEQWRIGECASPWNEPVPAAVPGFEAVFLSGGRSQDNALRAELSRLPSAVVFSEEPIFVGARGGFELLRARDLSGWVADWGQTQLKLAAPGWRRTFPRDGTRLHGGRGQSPSEVAAQRRRLREFIALKFQVAMAETSQRPNSVVFALPGAMADDGTPGGSSYVGMAGDRLLLPDALKQAGLAGLPLFVLNDAELAALGALTDERLAKFRKVLVLTLGFGLGAALIHRAA